MKTKALTIINNETTMKTLRFFGMALVAVVLSTAFTACSDDDDKDGGGLESQLKGTTWKVVSDTEAGFGEDYTGLVITFNKDYTAASTAPDSWLEDDDDEWDMEIWWSVSGDVLTLDLNHDDCMEGTFVIDGKKATYTYHWYDYDKKWSNKEYYIMTLEKQ